MPGTDVETLNVNLLPAPVRNMIEEARQATENPDMLSQIAALASILAGTNEKDILSDSTVEKSAEWVNKNFWLYGFRWHESDYADGLGFFQSWDISQDKDGERVILNNGSTTCMAQVYALDKAGLLPCEVMLTKADKPTKNGYYPQRLVAVLGEFPTE